MELLVKYEIFRRPDLYWKISVNAARNWNRLRSTASGRDDIGVIGRSINDIQVAKTNGFIDYQEDIPAYWRADALAVLYGGIVSEFKWKNFDVNLSMAYQVGRHMINAVKITSLNMNEAPLLFDVNKVSFWSKPGDQADYPFGGRMEAVPGKRRQGRRH